MTFLTKAKKKVEKQTSSLNQASTGSSPGTKSVVNVVTGSVSLPASQHPNQTGPGQSQEPRKERKWNPCLRCNVDRCMDLKAACHPMDS